MSKFLVVIEDEYNNKESFQTDKIGDTILEILSSRDLRLSEDIDKESFIEKLNSDYPYDVGSFDIGFYDIYVYGIEEDEDDYYNGRIMIFTLENEPEAKKLCQEFEDEIKDLRKKLENVEAFAEKYAFAKEYIMVNRVSEESELFPGYLTMGNIYKNLLFSRNIIRLSEKKFKENYTKINIERIIENDDLKHVFIVDLLHFMIKEKHTYCNVCMYAELMDQELCTMADSHVYLKDLYDSFVKVHGEKSCVYDYPYFYIREEFMGDFLEMANEHLVSIFKK